MAGEKRLFAIHQGALGDVITSFPALSLLKESGFEVDLACRRSIGTMARELGIARTNTDSESVLFSSIYSDIPEADSRLCRFLSAYDVLLAFSFSDALLANLKTLSGKPTFRVPPRPAPSERIRVQEHLVAGAKNAGLLKDGFDQIRPSLFQDLRIPGFDGRKILLHPGSGSPTKNWPLKHFVELEKMLAQAGFHPVFLLGPAEETMEADILKSRPESRRDGRLQENNPRPETQGHTFIYRGKRKEENFPADILKTSDLKVVGDNLKSAGGYIGSDSGVAHLAAWLGVPTLAVFGPTDPLRWKPAGRRVEIVHSEPDCGPCFETEKERCKNIDCLSRIYPTLVRDAFLNLIGDFHPDQSLFGDVRR
jgi:heptosyltransferase III